MPPGIAERNSVAFQSILFNEFAAGIDTGNKEAPEFFTDLNLDQIIASIITGRDEYNLRPFFYTPLNQVASVNYRHNVFRDLENQALFEHIQSFAKAMRAMRGHLAQAEKLHYKYQKQAWFLEAADIYCEAVGQLSRDLTITDLQSRGFAAFRNYLTGYIESLEFAALVAETQKLKTDLSGIRYALHIQGSRIKVGRYDSEPDYGADVLHTFEKFKQGAAKEYPFTFPSGPDMNHVEAAILELVAKLHPEIFSVLDEYCIRHRRHFNDTIAAFDREVQFYIACLEHTERFKRAGLHFCYPSLTDRSKEIYGRDVFDLALADRLVRENTPVVTNDFHLNDPERVLLVSGPNQGGKTTFARTFGQLHYLASLGCAVPGIEARLFLFDNLFTHFEREEDIRNLSGKLEDDLRRIHKILEHATPDSILIMNESFLSTTLNDAVFLSKEIMRQVIQIGMLCVSVTFLDELSTLDESIVSVASTVDPRDPARRTFKVIRKPADGLAYAAVIAEKYRLTYENVKQRISENNARRLAI
jgi:DNA mismatch repair ATPase MutS